MQWNLRRQGAGGKAAADADRQADAATKDVNKAVKYAGVDAPNAGDAGYQATKARSEARRAGSGVPKVLGV